MVERSTGGHGKRQLRSATRPSAAVWIDPPFNRERIEEQLDVKINDCVWSRVSAAHEEYAVGLEQLEATRLNQDKNSEVGWLKRRTATLKVLETAEAGLRSLDPKFLSEVNALWRENNRGNKQARWIQSLEGAHDAIARVADELRQVEPLEIECLSEAELKKHYVGELWSALQETGTPRPNGWRFEQCDGCFSDLSPFEQMVETLGIHQGDTPQATARWVRSAIKAQSRG